MSESEHHMLANVNVEETTENALDVAKRFYRTNRDVILIVGFVCVALWVNKRSLRRELRRINFSVEVFPDFEDLDTNAYN